MPEEAGRLVAPDLQRIGKYDILERIAEGGFATLYRGRDPFLKRLVAIKVCASEDPELRQQFLREAEIAGNLDHPSIVRTFDFGFDPVGPYLVQEYLQGEDLSQLIAQRVPLSTRRKLDLLVQIAEGLEYSHQRLVLHLDIKPGNVRVLGRRQAKILDFGIARLATADAAPAPPGTMLGTAGYLPPEQMMSRAVDRRADVFAFGALGYELLTYHRPFAGATVGELLKRVMAGEAEPLNRHWPDCDDALANLIGRCLRRDPAARYPSFEALLRELRELRDGYPEVHDDDLAREPPAIASAPAVSLAAASAEMRLSPRRQRRDPGRARASVQRVRSMLGRWRRRDAPTSPRWRRVVLVTAAAIGAVGIVAFAVLLLPDPRIAAADAPVRPVAVAAPPLEVPSPGLVVVTAPPWGEVTRLSDDGGTAVDLPVERVTPLRVWVGPGHHRAELTLPGGGAAVCDVEVVSGGTHLCAATAVDPDPRAGRDDYLKDMGWWR